MKTIVFWAFLELRVKNYGSSGDAASADLRKLLEERECEARRQKLLMAAIAKSDKSFEEVLRFLESSSSEE